MLIKPNFFILGAPKCGTTSMADWLGSHPDIFIPHLKEPHFFDTDHRRRIESLEEYEQLFGAANEAHKAVGEASVFYLFSSEAVNNIVCYNSASKFIVMLRNPFEMAYSMHRFYLHVGRENVTDFGSAWALDEQRRGGRCIPPRAWDPKRMVYRDLCALGEQVERLLAKVSQDRVHFVFLEDMQRDCRAEYLKVLAFLGVSDDGREHFKTLNAGMSNRFQAVASLSVFIHDIKHKLRIKQGLGILNNIKRMNARTPAISSADVELRAEVMDYFRDDVKKLAALTCRDLSHWN